MTDNQQVHFLDTFKKETRDHQRRIETLETSFKEDVKRLYRVYADDSGASAICGDILRIVHFKRGQIDPTEMFRLDYDNKAAALRVIELLASPNELSDDGLSGILSSGQLDRLLSE